MSYGLFSLWLVQSSLLFPSPLGCTHPPLVVPLHPSDFSLSRPSAAYPRISGHFLPSMPTVSRLSGGESDFGGRGRDEGNQQALAAAVSRMQSLRDRMLRAARGGDVGAAANLAQQLRAATQAVSAELAAQHAGDAGGVSAPLPAVSDSDAYSQRRRRGCHSA